MKQSLHTPVWGLTCNIIVALQGENYIKIRCGIVSHRQNSATENGRTRAVAYTLMKAVMTRGRAFLPPFD